MAYREVGMWEILEVLRRVHRGESQVAIARATGHTRKTIRRYTRTARKRGWTPDGSQEPDEALAQYDLRHTPSIRPRVVFDYR